MVECPKENYYKLMSLANLVITMSGEYHVFLKQKYHTSAHSPVQNCGWDCGKCNVGNVPVFVLGIAISGGILASLWGLENP